MKKQSSYQKLKAENKKLNERLAEMKAILNGERNEELRNEFFESTPITINPNEVIQRFFKGLRTQEEANSFPKPFKEDRGNDVFDYPRQMRRESDIKKLI